MTDIAERRTPTSGRALPKAYEIPSFASEEDEADFWASHDISPLFDQMEDVTHNPPPELAVGPGRAGSRARKRPPAGRMDLVSLRLPVEMIDGVKAVAARKHLPYQTMIRSWIGERLAAEQENGQPGQSKPHPNT